MSASQCSGLRSRGNSRAGERGLGSAAAGRGLLDSQDGAIKAVRHPSSVESSARAAALYSEGDYRPRRYSAKADHLRGIRSAFEDGSDRRACAAGVAYPEGKNAAVGPAVWATHRRRATRSGSISYRNLFTGKKIGPREVDGARVLAAGGLVREFPVALLAS